MDVMRKKCCAPESWVLVLVPSLAAHSYVHTFMHTYTQTHMHTPAIVHMLTYTLAYVPIRRLAEWIANKEKRK